jgi:saccharopine dehydrogenase (NAD+, L-lysine-forming)
MVDDVDEVVVADLRAADAGAVAAGIGRPGVRAMAVDAADPASLAAVLDGADVAVSCIGPFYRFGAPVLAAAIRAGVDFVDVCDDLDATLAQLELDAAAREAGVSAVIGMGNSPGLANVLTRYCADQLLDTVTAVDIMHIHGGEPDEGGAVVRHRIHAMTNDVPVFVDGEQRDVRLLEASGAEFVEETEFRDVGTFPVYPYPHPETITLPRHLPGLRRCTNRGVVFPLAYFQRTMDRVRAGGEVDDMVADILADRPQLLADAGVTGPGGCLKIVVAGAAAGEDHTYVFSLSSTTEGAGEGTGIPAGLAAIMVARGQIGGAGVHPPEAAVDPVAMLALAGEVVSHFDIGADGEGGNRVPIHIDHIRPDGTHETIDLDL